MLPGEQAIEILKLVDGKLEDCGALLPAAASSTERSQLSRRRAAGIPTIAARASTLSRVGYQL